MTGDQVPPASEPHVTEPRRRAPRPGALPALVDLERLRDVIQKRLDQIEALARERLEMVPTAAEDPEREQALLRQVADLEAANDRFRDQAERHEQEWRTALAQLEEDRKLLADAWERLESERIEGHVDPTIARAARPAPAERPTLPQVRSGSSGTPDDSVTQAILQQFHLLRSDVRRTANQRKAR
jgi:hypothetical protein